jgi:hypothetical protein
MKLRDELRDMLPEPKEYIPVDFRVTLTEKFKEEASQGKWHTTIAVHRHQKDKILAWLKEEGISYSPRTAEAPVVEYSVAWK